MLGDLAKNMALGAAERAKKTLGARAGLAAYRTIAEGSASDVRGRATLEAISCAAELGDEAVAAELVRHYGVAVGGESASRARAVALELAGRGWPLVAASLAALEVSRRPEPRTAYLHARCLERARDRGAKVAFVDAEGLAEKHGDSVVLLQARAFRAALLHEEGHVAEARALERSIALRSLPEALLFRLAPHVLSGPSRFSRAGMIGELVEVALRGKARDAALRLVCEHAERMAHALSALERDRVVALFSKLPDEALSAALLARFAAWPSLAPGAPLAADDVLSVYARTSAEPATFAAVRRAVDIAKGRFEAKVELPRSDASGLAFAAAGAVRDGDAVRAAVALQALAPLVVAAPALSRAPMWEAAYVALFLDDDGARAGAFAVLRALVVARLPPPRGALVVARAVRSAGDEVLAESLLAIAVAHKEAGAASAYVEVARELAWKAAMEGRRDDARRLLREAAFASR